MKRASTRLNLAVAAESPCQWTLSGAVRTVLGGALGLGFGVRAAGGGTGIGSATTPTLLPVSRLRPPAARGPPPVIRDRAAGGRRRRAGPGSGACTPLSGASGRGGGSS